MTMRSTALAVLLAALPPAAAAADKPPVKNSPAIQQYYQDALDSYAHEDYREAIIKWTAILKEDPDQKSAQTMIIDARQRLVLLTAKQRKLTFDFIASGQYRKALHEHEVLIDQDPNDPELMATQRRMESVIQLAPEIAPDSRAARATILGLKGYLAFPPDLKLAHNALRYACEIAPDEALHRNLLKLLYSDYPALAAADPVTPGMKLLEYKHYVALHQIYDAKHHLAVITLNEILALAPDDLMALKRLGSANYSLGRFDEARSAWSAAQKLAPHDKTLEHFLAKIRKSKSSSTKP
jgi:tetratricopeptide (TPR) repeat protein